MGRNEIVAAIFLVLFMVIGYLGGRYESDQAYDWLVSETLNEVGNGIYVLKSCEPDGSVERLPRGRYLLQ